MVELGYEPSSPQLQIIRKENDREALPWINPQSRILTFYLLRDEISEEPIQIPLFPYVLPRQQEGGGNSNSMGKMRKIKLLRTEVESLLNKRHKQTTWTFTCRTKLVRAIQLSQEDPLPQSPTGHSSTARMDFLWNVLFWLSPKCQFFQVEPVPPSA